MQHSSVELLRASYFHHPTDLLHWGLPHQALKKMIIINKMIPIIIIIVIPIIMITMIIIIITKYIVVFVAARCWEGGSVTDPPSALSWLKC